MWQSLRLKSALSRGCRMLGALARGGGWGGRGEEGGVWSSVLQKSLPLPATYWSRREAPTTGSGAVGAFAHATRPIETEVALLFPKDKPRGAPGSMPAVLCDLPGPSVREAGPYLSWAP